MTSSTNSSASSSPPPASPSPPDSPTQSFVEPPNLERLIQHFVVAKASLSSATHVQRAGEIVTNSRAMVEEMAEIHAVNRTARDIVAYGTALIDQMRNSVIDAADGVTVEFQEMIVAMDEVNHRFQQTLDDLRDTIVEASLQSKYLKSSGNDEYDEKKPADDDDSGAQSARAAPVTLYDFIDESSHTEIHDSLRELIDSYNESRSELDADVERLSFSVDTINDLQAEPTGNPTSPSNRPAIYDEPPPSIRELLRGVQEHATVMANLLGSLVTHYDVCVSALKHTEGGGQAAKQALTTTEKTSPTGQEESLYGKTAAEPIASEDKDAMLRVLENDAHQVEDVALEIRDRNAEQETQYSQLHAHAGAFRAQRRKIEHARDLMQELKTLQLPAHTHAVGAFKLRWDTLREAIGAKTAALGALRDTYENFLSGYAGLMHEVERRRGAEEQMRKVAEKAAKELRRLHEADAVARRAFVEDVGEWLPEEIWPKAKEEGKGWKVVRKGDGKEVDVDAEKA